MAADDDAEWNAILREAQARSNPVKAATSSYTSSPSEGVRDINPDPPPLHPLTGHSYQPPREKEQHPDYGADVAATVGAGQGLTAGWSAKGGALVDTFLSKAPPALRAKIEEMNAANGGHPGLSPLTDDLTYSQRLGEYNQRNTDLHATHPGATLGGQLGGGLVLGAGAPGAVPTSMGGAIGRGAAGGAIAGAGYSKGDPTTKEGLLDTGVDAAVGAGVGGTLSAAGQAIGNVTGNAQERIDKRTIRAAAKDAGAYEQKTIVEKAPTFAKVISEEPEVKAALGDPKKMQAALAPRLDALSKDNDGIYAGALAASTKAGGGGLPDGGIQSVIDHVRDEFKAGTKAQLSKIDAVEDQIKRLGDNPDPKAVRKFISDYLHGPGMASNPLHAGETTDTQQVLNAIGDGVKDKLHAYVDLHSAPGTLERLEANNEKIHVLSTLRDATKEQRFAVEKPGGEAKGGIGNMVGKIVHGVGPGGTGAALGAAGAHFLGGDAMTGAVAGAAVGEGLRRAIPVVDKALASKLGQWTGAGRMAPKAIPQPLIDQAAQGNDLGLRQHLQRSIFGDDKPEPGGTP